MIYTLHCTKCHHEWVTDNKDEKCDWCGADNYILEEREPYDFTKILNKLIYDKYKPRN